jgi:hypothetical protein
MKGDGDLQAYFVVQSANKKNTDDEQKWVTAQNRMIDVLSKPTWDAAASPEVCPGKMSQMGTVICQMLKDTYFLDGAKSALLRFFSMGPSRDEQMVAVETKEINSYEWYRDRIFYPMYSAVKLYTDHLKHETDYAYYLMTQTEVGKNVFAPDRPITRYDITTLLDGDHKRAFEEPETQKFLVSNRKSAKLVAKALFEFRSRNQAEVLDVMNLWGLNPPFPPEKLNKTLKLYLWYV